MNIPICPECEKQALQALRTHMSYSVDQSGEHNKQLWIFTICDNCGAENTILIDVQPSVKLKDIEPVHYKQDMN